MFFVADMRRSHRAGLGAFWIFVALTLVFAQPASAQYGGISGLFVTTSPDRPGFADFSGLGCQGGVEVVLYWPGLGPTSSDPAANQQVPGRILAVGTTASSSDPLENGTFSFRNIRLPDVEPGVYEVHARCGGLDLRVLIQIEEDGTVSINPDPSLPVTNTTGGTPGIDGALPLTGRNADRTVSLGVGFVAMGLALVAASRRNAALEPAT